MKIEVNRASQVIVASNHRWFLSDTSDTDGFRVAAVALRERLPIAR